MCLKDPFCVLGINFAFRIFELWDIELVAHRKRARGFY
jgi:hypothetical protein